MLLKAFVELIGESMYVEQDHIGPYVEITWVAGGMTGGSCWSGGADRPVIGEPEPDWTDLDKFLTEHCEKLSFIGYKKLMALTETGTRSDGGDYYGNYYEKGFRRLYLARLHDLLEEYELLPDE